MTLRTSLAVACVALAGACTAPAPDAPREWIEVSAGIVDPRAEGGSTYNDAPAFSLGGGYDLNDDPIVLSWEIGAQWSQHDVDVGGLQYSDDLDVLRVSTGLRARARLQDLPLGVHLRAGFEWRDESSDSGFATGVDQWGTYAGAGLDWWYTPFASLGPEVMWFHGDEDGLDELRFALSARFY